MIKKIVLVIVTFNILLFGQLSFVIAAPPHVSDCFGPDANEDCSKKDEGIQTKTDEEDLLNDQGSDKPSFLSTFIQTIFALLLVLALIYLLLKFMNKRNKSYRQVNLMENHGGMSVGPNKSIQIIRIGSKFYLIGVGNNVEMLREIDDLETVNELLTKEQEESPVDSVFKFIKKRTTKAEPSIQESKEVKGGFTDLLNQELIEIKKHREEIISKRADKGDQDE